MNHKEILAAIIVGLCLIFASALLYSISSRIVNIARLENVRGNTTNEELRNTIDLGINLDFVGDLLKIVGGLLLSVFSAVGAFIIEDKYATLGLLLFSALVTVSILTTIIFELVPPPYVY